jgi:cytidylate kinase
VIIAIAGMTASGKNTIGELIAKEFGYRVVCPTFKDIAKKEGISLMALQEKAAKDKNIDLKFDELLRQEVAKGNCVVTTWLGPWMAGADVKIAIVAPLKVRATRLAKRDGMTLKEAEKHVKERDEQNIKRYKSVYGIDITDYTGFDAVIDNSDKTPEQVNEIAMKIIETKSR